MNLPIPDDESVSFLDRDFKKKTVRILPGEYFVTNHEIGITTVLGSCVSACLRDPVAGIGGMNHFMLPFCGPTSQDGTSIVSMAARYGVHAMELTINEMLKLGARRERLEAKVFGGAAVIDAFLRMNVGAQNARFVLDFLKREEIQLVCSDLGGTRPRKVYFQPQSGRAFVKYLVVRESAAVESRERSYLDGLTREQKPREPEFFS